MAAFENLSLLRAFVWIVESGSISAEPTGLEPAIVDVVLTTRFLSLAFWQKFLYALSIWQPKKQAKRG